ncbi:MAG: GspH/FimT family pseudopilin [Rubrivivax sp.]
MMRTQRAFTVVEFMITVALIAVVASLAGPSMYGMVLAQRLKGINANLVTDLQYARSEAVSRGKNVWVQFKQVPASHMTCYTIYSDQSNTGAGAGKCDCTVSDVATRCAASARELKTVQIPDSLSVKLYIDTSIFTLNFAFDSVTGSIYVPPSDVALPPLTSYVIDTLIDAGRTLRTRISLAGRPSVCLPAGSVVTGGFPAC